MDWGLSTLGKASLAKAKAGIGVELRRIRASAVPLDQRRGADHRRVVASRQLAYCRAARQRPPDDASALVERFAGGVVRCSANDLDRTVPPPANEIAVPA